MLGKLINWDLLMNILRYFLKTYFLIF